jgi:copper homeostasis protein CutC
MDVFTIHVNSDRNLEHVRKNIENGFYEESVTIVVGPAVSREAYQELIHRLIMNNMHTGRNDNTRDERPGGQQHPRVTVQSVEEFRQNQEVRGMAWVPCIPVDVPQATRERITIAAMLVGHHILNV